MNDYGIIRDGKVYAIGFLTYPEREIGLVKGTDEEALAYFSERFTQLEAKVDEVLKKIEFSDNKGSFLMKLHHMITTLADQKALGDFERLHRKIKAAEKVIQEDVEHNRKRNAEIKEAMLLEIKELSKKGDWQNVGEIKSIQQRWLKVGKASEEVEEILQKEFEKLVNDFFVSRKQMQDSKALLFKDREEKYRELIGKAKELSFTKGHKKSDLDDLHKAWKEVGQVPFQLTEELWGAFQQATNQFYEEKRGLEKKGQQKAVERTKLQLLNDLKEEMKNSEGDVTAMLKSYLHKWKAIKGRDKELDDAFFTHLDLYFEKNFLNKIVESRLKKTATEEDKKAFAIKTLKDLIRRDKEDLLKIEETLGKIQITSEESKNPFNSRISLQKRKLKAKEKLLKVLSQKEGNFI